MLSRNVNFVGPGFAFGMSTPLADMGSVYKTATYGRRADARSLEVMRGHSTRAIFLDLVKTHTGCVCRAGNAPALSAFFGLRQPIWSLPPC
eukprot:801964-Pleurochrysis_carterae.AAC.3